MLQRGDLTAFSSSNRSYFLRTNDAFTDKLPLCLIADEVGIWLTKLFFTECFGFQFPFAFSFF